MRFIPSNIKLRSVVPAILLILCSLALGRTAQAQVSVSFQEYIPDMTLQCPNPQDVGFTTTVTITTDTSGPTWVHTVTLSDPTRFGPFTTWNENAQCGGNTGQGACREQVAYNEFAFVDLVFRDQNGNVVYVLGNSTPQPYTFTTPANVYIGTLDMDLDEHVHQLTYDPDADTCNENIFNNPVSRRFSTRTPSCPNAAASSFSASPSSVVQGQSSTLSWNVPGAASVNISGLGTFFGASGSVAVTPGGTTTYTLTSNGDPSCPGVTLQTTVSVTACPTVAGSSFSASPASIIQGQGTTLSWNVPNATGVTIAGVGSFGPSGSVVVSPSSTTTYTLTASGSAGCSPIQLQTTVSVTPCQTISSFAASATTLNAGQSTTLSYSLTGASSATITDLATGALTAVPVQSGSLVVTPPTSRTYRLTVNGPCATLTQDIAITVNPASGSISANPNPIISCSTTGVTTLSWTTSGVSTVDVRVGSPGGALFASGGPSGSATTGNWVVNGTVFYLQNSTAGDPTSPGNTLATVTVALNQIPTVINTFGASPSTINAGASSTLSWTSSNGSSASITDLTSGVVTAVPVNGSLVVTPPSTRTYRLTVSGTCGTVTSDVTVTVTQPPSISTFAASASPVCSGAASTLSWTATGGTSATISAPGLPGSPVSVNPDSGSLVVNPTSTTAYTLTVSNSAGSVTRAVTVTVNPAPSISSYSASATSINAGQSTTLTYSTANTTGVTITDLTSGTVTSVPVPNGSLTVTPPSTRTYRLAATNGCGTVTQDLTITVIQPPSISAFTASASPVCSGGASTLSWTASGGTTATISAAGLPGSPVAVNPNSGSLVVNPAASTTYTLTVTNSAGSVTRTVTVNVTPAPSISSYSASATTINAGQSTTLSYSTANATSASITDLTTGTATAVAVPSGSLVVTPPTTRTYRLTVNGACGTVTQDITITVTQKPVVNSFTASASPICSGASSTLSWSATGGTSATISAPGLPGSPVSVTPNSGTLVVSPTTTTTYTLTETNASGSTTATVTVTITPAPAIGSYTASPTTVVQGSSSTLTWTSSNGTSATVTDLTSGTVTSVAVSGTLSVTPATTRTYRLTINGSCGTATQDVTVTVTPCQTISTFTATATTITNGQSTTLSYSLTGATSATITDLLAGTVTSVPVQSGSLTVTPNASRTYRLSAVGPCATVTRDLAITVNPAPGVPMVGPSGQPLAVGPTGTNDDYTNMTAISGVGVPFGGTTTAGGVVTFTNTAFNNSATAQPMAFTARIIPAGFTVDVSADGGATWTNLNTGALTGTAPGGATYTLLVRVTYPANLNVLTAYPITLRLANTTDASFNETIDRLWTGFVRVDKSYTVTNSTGVGGATQAVRGAVIQYSLNYSNVTPAATGTGNVELFATNLTLTEDGNQGTNNWASTTDHVAGQASDSRGGTITGDAAGSNLITDVVPRLDPAQAGVFRYSRRIK